MLGIYVNEYNANTHMAAIYKHQLQTRQNFEYNYIRNKYTH